MGSVPPVPGASRGARRGRAAPAAERVAVLDFGGQYAQLIARRVREASVYCELLPGDTSGAWLRAQGYAAAILSGGPASVYGEGAPRAHPDLLGCGLPLLGICYGHQLLAAALGGRVEAAGSREYGGADLVVTAAEGVLAGLPPRTPVWMSHGDLVLAPPPGFAVLAHTSSTPVAAMADPARRIHGVQFHPEVAHTPLGQQVLRNFLFGLCGLHGTWTMERYAERAVAEIRATVGEGRAIAALSGGVDSTVATALVHRALGDRLTAVYVDHGLQRENEVEEVSASLAAAFPSLRLVRVAAQERFLGALRGVSDPERKRRIIGEEFIGVFEEEARRLEPVDFLVQGTIYPDVIESGSSATGAKAAVIKTHHNVGGLPERMRLRLVEPLRPLFKDEVRALGEELGLPAALVWRQPFPGPGLAIRMLGEVTPARLGLLRHADRIVREELADRREIWQAFAVLPGARTVGVMGDERSYGELVAVRAVASSDAMTADWARLPHEVLARISSRLTNEVPGCNRVVYDITPKPPATIEWE